MGRHLRSRAAAPTRTGLHPRRIGAAIGDRAATTVSAESHDHLTGERTDPEASERAASSAIAAAGSGGNAALGAAISEVVVRDVLAHMEHLVEASESQQRGQSTLFPLMALMKAQGTLAGRKALVFFSEGLSIPPNLEDAYRSAISEANRANVSIYAVDARGLDTSRALDQSRQMLDRSGRTSQAQLLFGGSQKPVTLDDIMSSERAEGALRTDTQNALRALAEETSGALIANTNELGPGLIERVRGDLDSYYEIGYTPGSGAADGRFRSVEVKVAKGITIHSRSGYFALPKPTRRRSCRSSCRCCRRAAPCRRPRRSSTLRRRSGSIDRRKASSTRSSSRCHSNI